MADRQRYLNARSTLLTLLGLGVIGGKFYGFGSNAHVYELAPNGSAMREKTTAVNWAHAAP